jgi:hypothetical protein
MAARRPKPADAPPAIELDLRAQSTCGPLTPEKKRFDIFVIDTGWNGPVSKLVRSHVPILNQCHPQDSLYQLTTEQSIEVLRHDPRLIGTDPIILVYDCYGSTRRKAGRYRGFRLSLGKMRHGEQAMARLQELVRFISMHRTAENLDREVRRELHREGIDGMVRILRDATTELL